MIVIIVFLFHFVYFDYYQEIELLMQMLYWQIQVVRTNINEMHLIMAVGKIHLKGIFILGNHIYD